MEFLGFKLPVIFAIVFAALFRVYRVKSKEPTFIGRLIDYLVTFTVSITFAMVVLHPLMMLVGIPMSYEVFVAIMLALSAEAFISKFLAFVQEFDLASFIEGQLRNWLKGRGKDNE